MKIISYSLFDHPLAKPFEKHFYVKGFWYNCRMNRFLFPDWKTHLNVDRVTYEEFKLMFDWLKHNHGVGVTIHEKSPWLCEGMMWRMEPIFTQDVSHVLCRDADSLTTYREALAVQEWLESGVPFNSIADNPGHSGLMGGLVGFDTARLKALLDVTFWHDLVNGFDLSLRGSDQHLMNQRILPKIEGELYSIGGNNPRQLDDIFSHRSLPQVDWRLYESNFCICFIGAAGINEMETIRFFKRFDAYDWAFLEIEKLYPKLFPWL